MFDNTEQQEKENTIACWSVVLTAVEVFTPRI